MAQQTFFITGIGTAIGKTLAAAVLAEALEADYWKPVQAGLDPETDSTQVRNLVSNARSIIHPELYRLKMAASPHIAARTEGVNITVDAINAQYKKLQRGDRSLVIEGAGGLIVPLSDREFVSDLAERLQVPVVLVSRNYLGSINHSLLTARACRAAGLKVAGWIFSDQYLDYEDEIVRWSGYPRIFSIPALARPDRAAVVSLADALRSRLSGITG